ncbi:hypothetical protein GWI33_014118 [Rhynchophorus ferrugineus]|uniref:Uncharacterized protein n=1 Tax=Rhynchophorus ferrugineus TaxID=354439 RepID=A0A834I2C1_RHYFE|nr:hypothetical protein GWI33_014118 [Rhynchophorus ferrugineus]
MLRSTEQRRTKKTISFYKPSSSRRGGINEKTRLKSRTDKKPEGKTTESHRTSSPHLRAGPHHVGRVASDLKTKDENRPRPEQRKIGNLDSGRANFNSWLNAADIRRPRFFLCSCCLPS